MADVFQCGAGELGWRWSNAHGGYISENHRGRPGEDPNGWGSYEVMPTAEEACFRDGLEDSGQVAAFLLEKAG